MTTEKKFWESFSLGAMTVTQFSDGTVCACRSKWFDGIDPALWVPALGIETPQTPLTVNFGPFLVESDAGITLVDSGFGPEGRTMTSMSAGGDLISHLADFGVGPGDVDRVLQTHLHADHCGWLLDEAQERPMFPNATVYVHQAELDYWMGQEVEHHWFNARMFDVVRRRVGGIIDAGLLEIITDDSDICDGISVVCTPGHTPGQMCVQLSSGDETALLVGDVAHHPVHLEHHDWIQDVNTDVATSIISRGVVADLAVSTNAVIAMPHMPLLMLGRLQLAEDGLVYTRINEPDRSHDHA